MSKNYKTVLPLEMKELGKEEIKTKKFYKILPEDLKCNGYQYHEGLNIDTNEFNNKVCQNGLHFSDATYIMSFCDYGTKIAEVEAPENETVLYNDTGIGIKYKAHSIILKNVRDLWDVDTFKELIEEGVNIYNYIYYYHILYVCVHYNFEELFVYIVDKYEDLIKNNNYISKLIYHIVGNNRLFMLKYMVYKKIDFDFNYALVMAADCGYLEIVKYLVECGVDIHTIDSIISEAKEYNLHPYIVEYYDSIVKK